MTDKIMKNSVIIVGGGHAGLMLAAMLGTHGVPCTLIDREDPAKTLNADFDGRTTAISYGSRKLLEACKSWDDMNDEACPIKQIDILDGHNSKNILEFSSDEVNDNSFGWIIENRIIRKALYNRIDNLKSVKIIAPAIVSDFSHDKDSINVHLEDSTIITGSLLVGADGRGSTVRSYLNIPTRAWSYKQQAIVCTVEHEHSHDHIAVEHFRAEGPFAVLPMTDGPSGKHRSSIVWTEDAKPNKKSPLDFEQDTFNLALQTRFPARYGEVKQIGKRWGFPLSLNHAHHYIGNRAALVADAAHGIHPIAGQGLNLGIRDIAELSTHIVHAYAENKDLGSPDLLTKYEKARRLDNMAMTGTTDMLNRLFSNESKILGFARKTGMKAIAKTPIVKRFFMTQAMGSAGILPDIIREA